MGQLGVLGVDRSGVGDRGGGSEQRSGPTAAAEFAARGRAIRPPGGRALQGHERPLEAAERARRSEAPVLEHASG